MIDQKHMELIDKLIKGTSLKKLNWERTDRETEFKLVVGSSTVTTDNWFLENGIDCVDMSVLNKDGEIIDRIAFENNDRERQEYTDLLRLYTAAKQSYFRVDEAFSELLSHLDF